MRGAPPRIRPDRDRAACPAAPLPDERRLTGVGEFDRVCGGGLVPGVGILIGGDPGIGKSTLLTEIACRLSYEHRVLYISGEEAADQVRLRARRLGLEGAPLELATATDISDIIATHRYGRRLPPPS